MQPSGARRGLRHVWRTAYLVLAFAIGAGLSLIALEAPAFAYVTNGWRWCSNPVSVTASINDLYQPYRLSEGVLATATSDWTNAGANFDFVYYYGSTDKNVTAYSDYLGTGTYLAAARWTGFFGCFAQGANIMFNLSFSWSPPNTLTCSTYDLASVARQEYGHLVGLDHSADSGSVMQATLPTCTVRNIGTDDRNGIISIYGAR